MYKFIQKNSKKLLAIFAAGLMIAFILPNTVRRGNQDGNSVVGKIGDTKVHASDYARAGHEWRLLSRLGDKSLGGLPITFSLATREELQQVIISMQTGQELPVPYAVREIETHPELYLLLQTEAREMGISASKDEVETILRNQLNLGRELTADRLTEIRQAVAGFLPVLRARDRAVSAVKVSDPLRKFMMSRNMQMISLNLVELRVSEFADKVAAPTTQQSIELYEKYKDVDPLSSEAMSANGFGYRLPDRVKLQYIDVSMNAVEQAVKQKKQDYDWEVEAYKYFSKNQQNYQTTTRPSESPANAMTLGATTAPAAAVSTTRPFEEVRSQIVDQLVREEARKQMLTIQSQIVAMLMDDWQKQDDSAAEVPAAAPTTLPSEGSGFKSHEYLQRIAATIEEQFKVRPNVTTIAEFQSALDLQDLPGIGLASADRLPLWALVLTRAKALAQDANAPSLLSLFEPSPPLTDFAGNVYFFRLTDVEKARPASFDEVAAKVATDWQMQQAHELARSAAQSLLDSSQGVDLAAAAKSANRPLISTGKFSARANAAIENYSSLPTSATPAFMQQAFNQLLMEAAKSGNEHPVAMIDLPQAQRVVVAELKTIEPIWDEASFVSFNYNVSQQITQIYEASVLRDWFSFNDVKERLKFTPENAAAAPAEPTPGNGPPISERPLL